MSKNWNDFQSALKEKGKPAEEAFYCYLASHYDKEKIKDVSNDSDYFKKGVDFIVNDGENTIFYDVKNDFYMHKTGNIAVEITTDKARNIQGWFKKMWQADLHKAGQAFIAYRSETTGETIMIDLTNMKKYLCKFYKTLRKVECKEAHSDKISVCFLVNKDDYLKQSGDKVIYC